MKSVSKEQYVEYVKANPYVSIKDIAEHFGIKRTLVRCHFRQYGLRLRELGIENFRKIPKSEVVAYASCHTMREIIEHFGSPAILSYVNRHEIPHIKKQSGRNKTVRKIRRSSTLSDLECEMVFFLSSYYSFESIGDVFGIPCDWVNKIIEDFNTGKRIATSGRM